MAPPAWAFACLLATTSVLASSPEPIDPTALIRAYTAVFHVKGNPVVLNRVAPVRYAEDRLRTVLHADPTDPISLTGVRNMSQVDLLTLLFKAVAGEYVTHKAGIAPNPCYIVADPDTGILESVTHAEETQPVLVGMCVVLLCILATKFVREQGHGDPPQAHP
jgi:hypothetical protein